MPKTMHRKNRTSRKQPTISKALLMEAAKKGPLWDYNRQLDDKKLSSIADRRYPILEVLPHFHAFMKPVEEHRRLVVEINDAIAIVDVPMDFYQRVIAA